MLAATAVVLLAGYLIYGAWRPLTFEFSAGRLKANLPQGARWIPLYHYAMGSPTQAPESVRLFVRMLVLTAAMTYAAKAALRARRGRGGIVPWLLPALGAGTFVLMLEFIQVFVVAPSPRVPSTTDVLCAMLGAFVGVWVYRHYPPWWSA